MDPGIAHRIASQNHETPVELYALELLTHAPGEPYEVYVRRIAQAPGPAGRLARIVKLADLADQLAHATIPSDAPPVRVGAQAAARHRE